MDQALLAARIREAEEAWPRWVETASFTARVEACLAEDPSVLAQLQIADLYLAHACGEGNAAALSVFDARVLPRIAPAILGLDASAAFVDEVSQALREKLFVGGRIREYSGLGSLQNWARVCAVRIALNLRRGRTRGVSADDVLDKIPSGGLDPELDYLKARSKTEFKDAFVAALEGLSVQERNVLRMHHLDGLTLEETALACRVGRSTAARWLAMARQRVMTETHRRLTARLKLSAREVESMFRLIQSQMDLSFHRYLAKG